METKKNPGRRNALGAIGALCASTVAPGASAATSGRTGDCSRDLVFPHTATTSVDVVATHANAQLTNSADAVVATISRWDQNFMFVKGADDGSIGYFQTMFSLDEVQQFWEASFAKTVNQPGGEQRQNEHAGRWYDLLDSRYSLTFLSSGTTITDIRGVFLFITWPDGLIGDLFFAEPPWVQAFYPDLPKDLTRKLVAYEDAWRSGNVAARLATIEDYTCASSARVADLTGTRRSRYVARTKDELRAAWSSPDAGTVLELKRLHHVVSTFYVFAAYRLVLNVKGRTVVRETATLLPLGPNGKFIGEMSYSFESPQ